MDEYIKAMDAPFTNAIIFGDSISDIGNFPESAVLIDPNDGERPQNIYVPVSNPVNTSQEKYYTVPGYSEVILPYPAKNALLPEAALIEGERRHYYSTNWPQYLLTEAFAVEQQHNLLPWVCAFQRDISNLNTSINYAWYSALSEAGCHDHAYGVLSGEVTALSVFAAQQRYREAQRASVQADLLEVSIPALLTQIEFFKQDLAVERVPVGENTVYIILIGGNDLSNAFNRMITMRLTQIRLAFKAWCGGTADNVATAVTQLITSNANAKHIYVSELFNLGLTPKAYKNPVKAWLARKITRAYNRHLRDRMARLREQHVGVSLHVVPLYRWFDDLAAMPRFKPLIGQQCDRHADYLTPAANPQNCTLNHGEQAYLFWNNAHLSSWSHQYIAHRLLNEIKVTWEK